jgi:hypothetical protein
MERPVQVRIGDSSLLVPCSAALPSYATTLPVRYYLNDKPEASDAPFASNTQPLTASELETFQSLMATASFNKGSFDDSVLGQHRSFATPSTSDDAGSIKPTSNPFAIDPSLVQQGTSPASQQPPVAEDAEMHGPGGAEDAPDNNDDDDDDDDESVIASDKGRRRKSATPGTSARKGGTGKLPHLKFEVPEYADKPSADEYKKLSSRL